MRRDRLYLAPVVLGLLLAFGCGGDGTARVTGKVTFKGAPVPAGKIYFNPDTAKGGKGASGYADIINGYYDTSSSGGRDAPVGPVIIAVEGIDPGSKDTKDKSEDVAAKLLFARYEVSFDVPKGGTVTKDIDVPASAEKGPVEPKGPPGVIIP
jgi:hypothetical protein